MELMRASRQWASRPADERFSSLLDLHQACLSSRYRSRVTSIPFDALRVTGQDDGEVYLNIPDIQPARLSHWAFGQLAERVKAPAYYLRDLPAPLASECLSYHLQKTDFSGKQAQILFHEERDDLLTRCVTSEWYSRIWNSDMTERLLNLGDDWQVPPARPAMPDQLGTHLATEDDVLQQGRFGLSIQVGDPIAPAGLYASDHDMFAFMVNESRRVEDGSDGGLSRGFMVWNSEVRGGAFGLMTFLYRYVCGNHIVWGAKDVEEVRIIHTGKEAEQKAFQAMTVEIQKYADMSDSDERAKILKAKRYQLGRSKEKVLEAILGLRIPVLNKTKAEAVYATAEAYEEEDGSPKTAWGYAQAITRYATQMNYADHRVTMDRAATRVLAMAN